MSSVASDGVTELLAGLPATLDALLAHPERHRPAVVERLLELTDELRRRDPQGALALAEAALRLAAGIPAFFPREERFRLRAKSFDVWGSLKRRLGDGLSAEGGFMAALELLAQTAGGDGGDVDLAAVLGRHALIAGDRGDEDGVSRYVNAGLEIAQSLDGDRPLATIQPMMEAIMDEEDAILPTMYTVVTLVANTATLPDNDGGGVAVGTLVFESDLIQTEDDDGVKRWAIEVILRRVAPASGGLSWKISATIRLYSQQECEIALVRQVPSASGEEWVVEDQIAWVVYGSLLRAAGQPHAQGQPRACPHPARGPATAGTSQRRTRATPI